MSGTVKTNSSGFTRKDYTGGKSTLCTGCGHDSITNNIISAYFQSGVSPYKVAKVSGIGCSSKTPAYFLNLSHGFNSLHGRMAPLATGAKAVNYQLNVLGVSGDGDTASIGLGGFAHLIRRNLPMVYIIENNGVYGLTKGQFSATADVGSTIKSGEKNPFSTIDICSMAIDLGCAFVARSFSGDSKQLVPLIDAAIRHKGTAIIDVVSPCVTFANHDGSTKSYNYVKEHKVSLHELGFIQPHQEITVDYDEGTTEQVKLPDGSILTLSKIDSLSYDYKDSKQAMMRLQDARAQGEILTGLLYMNSDHPDFASNNNLTDTPLVKLSESEIKPSKGVLKEILNEFK